MIERRRFLYGTALLLGSCRRRSSPAQDGGLCEASVKAAAAVEPAAPVIKQLNARSIPWFVDALPRPPIARPQGVRPDPDAPHQTIPYFRVPMREVMAKVHRDLSPTRLWTYAGSVPGPTFETRSGRGLLVEWVNELPEKHFLPIDHHLCGAGTERAEVRTVVHVHGARVPPESDGYLRERGAVGQRQAAGRTPGADLPAGGHGDRPGGHDRAPGHGLRHASAFRRGRSGRAAGLPGR